MMKVLSGVSFFLSAILATASFGQGAVEISQEQTTAEFPAEEGRQNMDMECVSRIFPMMDFGAASVAEDGTFIDVTGGNEDQVMRAGKVRCTVAGIEADDVSFFPNIGVTNLLQKGSSIRIGHVKAQPSANVCAMGSITEMKDFRVFSWSEDATGNREVVMKINGKDISRPLIYKISMEKAQFIPRASEWNCRISGDLHAVSPVMDMAGNTGPIRFTANAMTASVDLPLDVEEYGAHRDPRPIASSVVLNDLVYLSGSTEIGRSESVILDAKFPDATTLILMARKYAGVLALPAGRFDGLVASADLSNALVNSEMEASLKASGISIRPGVALGRIFPADYSSIRVMGMDLSANVTAKGGVMNLTSTLDIERLAKFTMSAGIAPRSISRSEVATLKQGRGDHPVIPRRARLSVEGEDLGLAQIMRSVYGFGMDVFPAAEPFVQAMESGKAGLMFSWDQETGRKISIRKVAVTQ